jgi:hypothetical protein
MKRKLFLEEKYAAKVSFLKKNRLSLAGGFVFFLFLVASSGTVQAIPSYARQTGLSCSACHTVFPELTSFGRQFKLNGYTLTGIKTINQTKEKKNGEKSTLLKLLSISPLSAMVQTGITHVNTTIPGTQNNNIEFPQQLSLFYGGQITPHIGTFIQLTMDGSGSIGMDNTDIRYSNSTKGKIPITYGFTLNNNPTVQDVWNTTPAWGFPYTSSGVAPTPGAGPVINDLGGMVAGLGGYTLINNLVYLEFSGYGTAQLGINMPPDASAEGVVKGIAPYWRAAIQHQWDKSYLEAGTFGMSIKMYPSGISGNTDNYTDFGFDLQYEFMFKKGQFTLHTSYINEKQTLNASYASGDSQNLSNKINAFKIDGSVFLQAGVNFTLGYFNTTGTADNVLYAPADMEGSRTGVPNSSGLLAQFDYLPWKNTKISLQYVAYSKFNGAKTDYDGSGRSASDNNSIYLQLWFLF